MSEDTHALPTLEGDSQARRKLPKSVILVAGAAALASTIPLIYLLRQRGSNSVLQSSLQSAPRRSALPSRTPIGPIRAPAATAEPSLSIATPALKARTASALENKDGVEDNFNGALYSAKAFGLATLLVTVTATATVLGVKSWMGVQTTQEFAHRMRSLILEKMPVLAERIHRLTDTDPTAEHPEFDSDEEWSWPEAERRLSTAFEREGFTGWAAAVVKEVEAEGRLERARRLQSETAVHLDSTSYSHPNK